MPAVKSDVPLSLRVFRDPAISERDTWLEIRSSQMVWQRYGVRLAAPRSVEVLKRPVWLTGYASDLMAVRADASSTPLESRDETAAKLLRHVALANLKDFWTRNRPSREAEIWLVLTPRLVKPGTLFDGVYQDFQGLAVSSFAPFAREVESSNRPPPPRLLFDDIRNNAFPPTLLLVPRSRHGDSFVGAHEMGHILGLPHRDDEAALMATHRLSGCRPILLAEEQGIALKNIQTYIKPKNQGEETAQP